MAKKTNPEECVLKSCSRRKDGVGALLCPAHWKLVPRHLKLALWEAEKVRSRYDHEFRVMCAAGDILDFVDKLKIELPPEVRLAKPESEIETSKPNEPRIIHP